MMAPTKEEIQQFLETTPLSTYQRIPLPHGLEIPGKDHSRKINAVFEPRMDGKSVLDVGCYYGLYLHEAKKRGADRVVGVEIDEKRFAVAQKVAQFIGDGVEILNADIMTAELDTRFDIILLLSVLHHVTDPIAVMHRLASLCRDTLIVEFCLPLSHLNSTKPGRDETKRGPVEAIMKAANDFYTKALISMVAERVGIIVTGGIVGEQGDDYDWTYFFNQQAFRTVFEVQHKLFSEIKFVPSPQKRNRILAYCKVNAA